MRTENIEKHRCHNRPNSRMLNNNDKNNKEKSFLIKMVTQKKKNKYYFLDFKCTIFYLPYCFSKVK